LFAETTGEREYLRPLVTVAIYAGPRCGELLKLRWANVDFDLNAITFKETKINKDRSVPMDRSSGQLSSNCMKVLAMRSRCRR
jgi:integrase